MAKSYTMRAVQQTADRAVQLARAVMDWQAPEGRVHDVQSDPRFQPRGVDLLWEVPGAPLRAVEVKGDRYAHRGNYFFELISNFEKNTAGCFLYTEADLLAYAFVLTREIHLLPVRAVREWFLPRANDFVLRHTQTRTGPVRYTTVGALVPIRRVLSEVSGCQRCQMEADGKVVALGNRDESRKRSSDNAKRPSTPG